MTTVYADQTDPDVRLAWPGDSGLRDLTGWTLEVEIIDYITGELVDTKTDGVTGGDGTGQSNVNIAFTADELDELADTVDKVYRLRVTADDGDERAVFTTNAAGGLPTLTVKAVPQPTS